LDQFDNPAVCQKSLEGPRSLLQPAAPTATNPPLTTWCWRSVAPVGGAESAGESAVAWRRQQSAA